MLIRSLICLAVAALLSMLAPAPAQAQIEIVKFQGWMWNNSGGVITVQRVTSQCWDPQQLAYQQIQPLQRGKLVIGFLYHRLSFV